MLSELLRRCWLKSCTGFPAEWMGRCLAFAGHGVIAPVRTLEPFGRYRPQLSFALDVVFDPGGDLHGHRERRTDTRSVVEAAVKNLDIRREIAA